MAQSFDSAISLETVSENEHRFVLPDGWQQGRGAFGGLVLGALMKCLAAREEDQSRTPRAFTGDLCGPALPVETRVVSRVLRRGNKQTNIAAVLEQDGSAVAQATCVLAATRDVAMVPHVHLEPPLRIPYSDAEMIPIGPPLGPVFATHYEYRPTGPLPFSSSKDPVILGWIKERVPLKIMSAAALLGRLDAFFPAVFSVEAGPRPIATVSFAAQFLCDPALLDPSLPLFYRARVVAQTTGYFVEMRELWNGDQPVALNQQTFALLG